MATSPPVDQSRINLLEPDEVQYWADKFDVSKERLCEAVRKVGHSVDAVRRALKDS
jgi:hypothetical protein